MTEPKITRIPPEDPAEVRARDHAKLEQGIGDEWAKAFLRKGRRVRNRTEPEGEQG